MSSARSLPLADGPSKYSGEYSGEDCACGWSQEQAARFLRERDEAREALKDIVEHLWPELPVVALRRLGPPWDKVLPALGWGP